MPAPAPRHLRLAPVWQGRMPSRAAAAVASAATAEVEVPPRVGSAEARGSAWRPRAPDGTARHKGFGGDSGDGSKTGVPRSRAEERNLTQAKDGGRQGKSRSSPARPPPRRHVSRSRRGRNHKRENRYNNNYDPIKNPGKTVGAELPWSRCLHTRRAKTQTKQVRHPNPITTTSSTYLEKKGKNSRQTWRACRAGARRPCPSSG